MTPRGPLWMGAWLGLCLLAACPLHAKCSLKLHQCDWGGKSYADKVLEYGSYDACMQDRATFKPTCIDDRISACECSEAGAGNSGASGSDGINEVMAEAVSGALQGNISYGDAAGVVGMGMLANAFLSSMNSPAPDPAVVEARRQAAIRAERERVRLAEEQARLAEERHRRLTSQLKGEGPGAKLGIKDADGLSSGKLGLKDDSSGGLKLKLEEEPVDDFMDMSFQIPDSDPEDED